MRTSKRIEIKMANGETTTGAVGLDAVAFGTLHAPAGFAGSSLTIEGLYRASGEADDWRVLQTAAGDAEVVIGGGQSARLPDEVFGSNTIRLVAGSAAGSDLTFVLDAKS